MDIQHIGIEDARARLGDLVTAARQGADIILTRNRRPVARITAYQEDTVPVETIADLSPGTLAAIANLVEYTIEKEYGTFTEGARIGARITAIAGVQMDVAAAYLERNAGDDRYLHGYADTTVRMLVAEGLEARRCQCAAVLDELAGHDHIGACAGHYEADVPQLDGKLLCGTCHVAVYNRANGLSS